MIRELGRFERISAHSHIRGLGLDENLRAKDVADGLVGQKKAREAAGVIVRLIKSGKMAGRGILLAGPPGTGKTAIAVAISKELGRDIPFVHVSASEFYSAEMKKTEALIQSMRKAIGVRIRERRIVLEGEIVGLDYNMIPNPYNPTQKIPESANLTLATTEERRSFSVGGRIALQFLSQGIEIGDVIIVDKETGRVSRIGRSEKAKKKYDIGDEDLVPVPSGRVEKEREFTYVVTLHDLDEANARRGGIFSLFAPSSREIDNEVRQEVDEHVRRLIEEGRAELLPGVMFIDETHLMDIELFAFMNRAMESEMAPIIILASNRGFSRIRGTDIVAPHGIPLDLLDRLLIITTEPYSREEIRNIIDIRALEMGVTIDEKALEKLTDIGEKMSLRYAVQLLAPANEFSKLRNSSRIELQDVERAESIFSDVSQSSAYLKKWEEKMLGM
ncbi:MAG: RuvB-like helicase [Archaeoglobales archaeon]|jgi:TBP-interacting protein|nr:RuvB-like helicase [Archaeoglobi archaeon]NHW23348.1 RuvB-like helicase [Archaeoglobales archaeon]TDA24953.1 MAG: TATA box-binding protein [Archaeoglobi archaeon]TDA25129.1 MAG: TATA box-binding protein [Archaeoglobi archaeon]TDA25334.1 MAG: TATA box-binding protein [Archaeoglobi archaeon]